MDMKNNGRSFCTGEWINMQNEENKNSPEKRTPQETKAYLREKSMALPRIPGVYIMENESGKVIYVGKSRSLRDRVSQYFHGAHDEKTSRMAANVYDFRFVTCDTEMEALALENSLIKQYTPKYNIKLKDAKSYPYIRLNVKAVYPRITMTRKRIPDGSLYFGPYSSTQTVYSVIGSLERTLGIPSCKRRFPEDIGKGRPCVYYQIGRCVGLCTGCVTEAEYRERIDRAAEILRGGTRETIEKLSEKMQICAENLQFEEAARCRDTIEALRKLSERQKAVGSPDVECDVLGLYTKSYGGEVSFHDCLSVFYIRSGYIADSEHVLFDNDAILMGDDSYTADSSEDPAVDTGDSPMTVYIASLYQNRSYIPGEIFLSFELPERDCQLLSDYISDRAGHRVQIRTPKRGSSRYLCDMAVKDARTHSENTRKRQTNVEETLVHLAAMLGLEVLPERIEAYDISNLGDEHITAGMITVVNGRFEKNDYRMFRIKNQTGADDYAAMRETLSRRFAHFTGNTAESADALEIIPDLILLDGGEAHVHTAREVMAEMHVDIPVFGMVKDEFHKTRTLTDGENEIRIARQMDVFRFVYGIQEEVHRYTVGRMMQAKRKTLKTSTLEAIPGIGQAKAKLLLSAMGSLTAVKKAQTADLSAIPGISTSDAERIYTYFRTDKNK